MGGGIALVLAFTMWGAVVDAQPPTKIPRIGYLDNGTASGTAVLVDAFRQELRKLGWTEGKNIAIEYRFAEQKPERLPDLAAELVRLKVDLIVTSGRNTPLAAKQATTTLPIVMTTSPDPVREGLVKVWRGREAMSQDFRVWGPNYLVKGWRYLRTQSLDCHELGFCGRLEAH